MIKPIQVKKLRDTRNKELTQKLNDQLVRNVEDQLGISVQFDKIGNMTTSEGHVLALPGMTYTTEGRYWK